MIATIPCHECQGTGEKDYTITQVHANDYTNTPEYIDITGTCDECDGTGEVDAEADMIVGTTRFECKMNDGNVYPVGTKVYTDEFDTTEEGVVNFLQELMGEGKMSWCFPNEEWRDLEPDFVVVPGIPFLG